MKAAHLALLASSLLVCALVTPASAQSPFDTPVEAKDFSSPQNFAFEFKLGPYTPNIDGEFDGGASPYEDLFGDGSGIMISGEADWQIWRGFGSVGVGLTMGYFSRSAEPFADDGNGGPTKSRERVAGETSITLFPISVLAVYRFDVLAERWSIPLVPYAKIGLNYTFWWIRKGDGAVASIEGNDANGGSFGWQFNLGIAVQLDLFEPDAAKSLDANSGINHSYVFFEMMHLAADGFGSETTLDVGDTTWLAGLAIEF
ncbi:MAG: hypothetical protein CSA65_05750 [Proteobacteria bacterium]|nr:MAG: hypothetical protein CSB49_02080 [Pseudomonadota bacterium]PIE18221.1 MAG: hypothetical protein CSA65_05750 [Pseudomonadota bacterium]